MKTYRGPFMIGTNWSTGKRVWEVTSGNGGDVLMETPFYELALASQKLLQAVQMGCGKVDLHEDEQG